jgi:outer membrane protein assembly factor BamB
MKKYSFIKANILITTIILLISSTVIPMAMGNNDIVYDKKILVENEKFNRSLYPEYYDYYNIIEIPDSEKYINRKHLDDDNINPDIIINPVMNHQLTDSPPMDSPWPMYCHDTRHTGRSPYSTANSSEIEKWQFPLNTWVGGSPVIDNNGIIYIGSHTLYAIYPNGTLKWQFDGYIRIVSAPAIDKNGVLYVGSIWATPNYLYAIYTNNGTLKWKYQTSDIYSSPAIGSDGTIYFGDSENWKIKALNPNGTLKWAYKTGYVVYSSPAIGDDGTIYCGSHDTNLYALYPNNGTVKWKHKTGNWIRTSPCIGDDGTIYVVSLDNYLYAVYPNGSLKWKTNMGEGGTSPTIGQDGTIYCGYTKLHAINPTNGTIIWKLPIDGKIRGATPCNSIDGTIYLGNSDGSDLIVVNPDGTEKWRITIGGDVESAPAIGEDGTIYIGDGRDDGCLHAFGPLDPDAPTAPDIKGPRICLPGIPYEYEFTSTSPLGNKVYYLIEWGDDTVTGWSGTYESGETRTFYHTWELPVKSTIKARAKDTDNLWGPWSELNINKDRTRATSYYWLLDSFSLLEKLISLLL